MKTKIVQVWNDHALFENRLNETITNIQPLHTIIDIKYSTSYDSLNQRCNYSALIIFKG